jgi:hypothetical protein
VSTQSVPLRFPEPQRPGLELVELRRSRISTLWLRAGVWIFGISFAAMQAWAFRYYVSADAISYLDMSDGAMPGGDWHRLINGVWSPLYPLLLGIVRRMFHISPANEIVAGHLLNLAFFLFAFACFEVLLRRAMRKIEVPLDLQWIFPAVAYSLFLWGSIAKITLMSLRADMLMSGFVYLAAAILLHMKDREARWSEYCLLGVVLGMGILAKEPVLPLGAVILAATLFAVKNWRTALKMVAVSSLIFLAIGSLYFLPLSLSRGHFTLGESGTFNYLVYVDKAQPMWYLQQPGLASGGFVRSPQKIYSTPSVYAFSHDSLVTHPLRFDPSDWIAGAHIRFAATNQLRTCLQNVPKLARSLVQLSPVLLFIVAMGVIPQWNRASLKSLLGKAWPIWVIGLTGLAMYVPLRIESRYIGAFLALLFMGAVFSFDLRSSASRRVLIASAMFAVLGLLLPVFVTNVQRYLESLHLQNADADAAAELAKLGINPGDQVARISSTVTDLGIERIARVEVVAEVGIGDAHRFWTSPVSDQDVILGLFASNGARAVIATAPDSLNALPGWRRLGLTHYWVWLPNTATGAAFHGFPSKSLMKNSPRVQYNFGLIGS